MAIKKGDTKIDSVDIKKPKAKSSSKPKATSPRRKAKPIIEESTTFRNDQKGKVGLIRIYNAFFYSLDGIKAAYKDEEAFRQIALLCLFMIPLGAIWGESWSEKILLILPCILALISELVNSAIENAIDHTSLDIHPLAKKAKDMGSAVQLIACIFWAFVWISYFIYRMFHIQSI